MISQYEQYFKEECQLYNDVLNKYKNLKLEDMVGLDELRKTSIILSSNFVTMKSNSDVIADKIGTSKTQFADWCYQRYRILMEIHTDLSVDLTHSRNDIKQYGTL